MNPKGRGTGKSKKASNLRGIIVLAVVVIGLLAYFYYLANHSPKHTSDDVELTVVQELLLKDIDKLYPATPKEVVKLYSDITKCFYGEKYSSEELYALAEMSYKLFDAKLKEQNPMEQYYNGLTEEIEDFKEKKCIISAYSTSSSTDIENAKFEKDGYSCTKVYVYYTLRQGTVIKTLQEVFVLRKDKSGYWRIFGWDVVSE